MKQRLGLAVLRGHADQRPDALALGDALEQVGQPAQVARGLPARGDRRDEPLEGSGQAFTAADLLFRLRLQKQVVVD